MNTATDFSPATTTSTLLTIMNTSPVIPVMVIEDVNHAVPLARALVAGGLKVLEITLRTDAALESIQRITAEVPEAIVGAGTLAQPQQFEAIRQAGAQFAVSPGYTAALSRAAQDNHMPLLPGIATPSDVLHALERGHTALKFFPAEQNGGIPMLKALHGPFPQLNFCPTGGITLSTAAQYLAQPNVCCVGGSWLTPAALVKAQQWSEITQLAQQTVAALVTTL